ncbi:MAG TPA: GDSL-type esterase/lipase family protein [Kiritimatiellia bacterium]|nr:GDSL-type esterase/lipase family protein [Kiritimatiellia bacterium]
MNRFCTVFVGISLAAVVLLTACDGGGGGKKYGNHDFGDNDPNKVVALGDSITSGFVCDEETQSYPSRIAGITGLTVLNAGKSGERSSDAAARTGNLLDKNKPGFLLVLTGHNDAIFDRDVDDVLGNIRSIINSAKGRKVIPIVGTLVPIGSPRSFATGPALAYSAGIRALAAELDVPLVDIEKEFGSDPASLQCDGLHPNDQGSAIIAAAFADKLP